MNLNLIPNIEPHQKYIDYFAETANTPATSADYILIQGQIPIQEELKKEPKAKPGTVQLIDPRPEVLADRAQEELKSRGKRATPAPAKGPPTLPDPTSDEEDKGEAPVSYYKPEKKRQRKSSKKGGKSSAPSYVFNDIFSGRR